MDFGKVLSLFVLFDGDLFIYELLLLSFHGDYRIVDVHALFSMSDSENKFSPLPEFGSIFLSCRDLKIVFLYFLSFQFTSLFDF